MAHLRDCKIGFYGECFVYGALFIYDGGIRHLIELEIFYDRY